MTGAGTNHSLAPLTGGPKIILVEPQMGENIGMAARAMANFGLSDMRIVNPRDGWPNERAVVTAANAAHVLERAQVFPDLLSAVADLNAVYATTARERGQMKRVLDADEALTQVLDRLHGGEGVGILFGRERTGLDNDEVALADAIVTFPVDPANASLNLAQAVLLVGYEWFKKAHGQLPFNLEERSPPAKREALVSFFGWLETELDTCGFFPAPEKKPAMIRNLRDILLRLSMTEQDVKTLRGAAGALRRGPVPPAAKQDEPLTDEG
ncbi:MAG: RNA methyltransferase [Pseudochelatococcus sp.]|uniref:RNA methyltransferase n=1 Tax=Pseudochelatococcus sp. TaxID=2020869 RepID=UPI003D9261E0